MNQSDELLLIFMLVRQFYLHLKINCTAEKEGVIWNSTKNKWKI